MDKDKVISKLSWEFGHALGLDVSRDLPTLSCDMIHSRNLIQVTWGEVKELKKLDDIWYKNHSQFKGDGTEDPNWITLQKERRKLETKYLPKTHTWFTMSTFPEGMDMDNFKKGLVTAMWNCDYSHYSCDTNDVKVVVETKTIKPRKVKEGKGTIIDELMSEPYTYTTTEIILKLSTKE